MALTFSPSALGVGARDKIQSLGGTVQKVDDRIEVVFPEGTETEPSYHAEVWGGSSSFTIKYWKLPDGTRLHYSTDWDDQVLALSR